MKDNFFLVVFTTALLSSLSANGENSIRLSDAHKMAVNRQRRIIFQDDVNCPGMPFTTTNLAPEQIDDSVNFYMSRLDAAGNQIDSVWYEWGEGNIAYWSSKILPQCREVFPRLWEAGLDPVKLLLEGAKKRGREVFFSYRVNGSDNGIGEFKSPMKVDHPEWLIRLWHDFWDFSFKGVRDHKVAILQEVAELYDFDGISIDYARVPVLFPEGTQWKHRNDLTDFMRRTRLALLEVGKKRGRPLLLAARVPENLIGCHFDGLDVETWAREKLVDIFVIGVRSSNVDIAAFRRITAGTGIKIYPSFDDHHSSDGYYEPAVEVWRAVASNWWQQGADGIHTFNLVFPDPKASAKLGFTHGFSSRPEKWRRLKQVNQDIGSVATLAEKDKLFYVQRRGGGHGERVFPNPENWSTPRHMYFNTNMLAPLPATLDNDGKADTLLTLSVGDNIAAQPEKLRSLTLRLLLSDPAAENLAKEQSISRALVVGSMRKHRLYTIAPARDIVKKIELRINNLLLQEPRAESGWLLFDINPRQLAVGENLIGVRVKDRDSDIKPLVIEKLELSVLYR